MKSMKAMLKKLTHKGEEFDGMAVTAMVVPSCGSTVTSQDMVNVTPQFEKEQTIQTTSVSDSAEPAGCDSESLLHCSVSAISVSSKAANAPDAPGTPLKSMPVGQPGALSVNQPAQSSSCNGGDASGAGKDRIRDSSATLAVNNQCPAALRRDSWCVSDFDLRALLYNGNISMVYHAVDKRSGITVALKLYKRYKLTLIERHQVAREIKLHSGLVHDSIIAMYAAWKDKSYVYLALEWAPGGDVYSYLRASRGRLSEDVAVSLILEPFLSGLEVIHARGLIHRDIKPENILLNHSFQIKIADFGLSIDSKNEVANTRLGTIDYLAPEILDCPVKQHPTDNKQDPSIGYTAKVDCWSVGVLAYELLTGGPPFAATLYLIRTKEVEYPTYLSRDAVDFMRSALMREPSMRPTIPELLQHAWIKRYARRPQPSPSYVRRNSVPLSLATQASTWSAPGHSKGQAPQSAMSKLGSPKPPGTPNATHSLPIPSATTTPTKPASHATAARQPMSPPAHAPQAVADNVHLNANCTVSGPLPITHQGLLGSPQAYKAAAPAAQLFCIGGDSGEDQGADRTLFTLPESGPARSAPIPPTSPRPANPNPDAANLLGVAAAAPGSSRTAKFYSAATSTASAAAAAIAAGMSRKASASPTSPVSPASNCSLPPIDRSNSNLGTERPPSSHQSPSVARKLAF